ncbi:unnamed protein product [Penicillium glandicola]
MEDKYAHLLVREHFDWWEDVENDIAIKAKARETTSHITTSATKLDTTPTMQTATTSTSHATATKLDEISPMQTKNVSPASTRPATVRKLNDKYTKLLVREQFDWWEDVENDIAMKAKALAMDTGVPTLQTEDIATTSTGPPIVSKQDDKYDRLPSPEEFELGEEMEDDIAIETEFLATDTDCLVTDNELLPASSDPVAIIESENTYAHILHREASILADYINATLPVDTDSRATSNELFAKLNRPVTAAEFQDSYAHHLHSETCDLDNDANAIIDIHADSLAINNEIVHSLDGPVTAAELQDSCADPLHCEPCELDHDSNTIIDVHDDSLAIKNEIIHTLNGPVTSADFDNSSAEPLHCETLDSASDVHEILPMDHPAEMSNITESSDETAESPQSLELSQFLDDHSSTTDVSDPVQISHSVEVSEPIKSLDPVQLLESDLVQLPEPESVELPEPVEYSNEYERRSVIGSLDAAIHHWNWLGQPVYQPTTTPAVDSLAFMQARPKAPEGRDELRVGSIMNRAIQKIDPIVLRVDRGNEAIVQMHGSTMIAACQGLVYTHYSLHGNWMTDDFSVRQWTVPDAEGPDLPGFAVGNGISENRPFVSCYQWMQWRASLVAATQQPVIAPRKLTWKQSPSRFKIEAMQLPPSKCPTYYFVPLQIISKVTHKAWATTKNVLHVSIAYPVGIMGTTIKQTWPRPKTTPGTSSPFRLGIMGRAFKKARSTANSVLRKAFAVPRGMMKKILKKS